MTGMQIAEPTPEEVAEVRARIERTCGDDLSLQAHYVLGGIASDIKAYARDGYDPGRNRRALAWIRALEDIRGESIGGAS